VAEFAGRERLLANCMTRTSLVLLASMLALAFAGCQNQGPLTAPCPVQPTRWTVGSGANKVELQPSDFPVAARAAQTSIDIELGQLYMRRRINAALEAPPPDKPTPDSGIFVDDVGLSESGSGPQKVNLLTLRITPWLRGGSGQPASLQRSYRVQLKIVPYLVTPSTVADAPKRHAMLGGADSGAALRFELAELFSLVNQAAVACSSPNYDIIDSNVLGSLYDSLSRQDPLVLPSGALTSMADSMLGSTTNLVGMNVGSDLDLKIGLTLDQGAPTTFDAQTSLPHFPSADWGVRLDTAFVTAAITSTARSSAAALDPAASISSVNVAYNPAGIDVVAMGALNKCGTIHFASNVHVTPLVRRRADGKVIVVAPSSSTQSNDAGIGNGICIVFDQILQSFAHPMGRATATISTGGECAFPMGSPVEFDAGPNDHFYAIAVDTDAFFYIAGRSTFMDQLVSPRPAVTPCP
jgi:hypothetical protein